MAATLASLGNLTPQAVTRITEKEMWYTNPWASFMGEIRNDNTHASGTSKVIMPTKSPITKFTQFKSEGTDTLYVPRTKRLIGNGILGDLQLEGNEEDLATVQHPVYVNALAHAVNTKIGPMNTLRDSKIQSMLQARPSLVDWYSDRLGWGISKAFYEGFDPGIIASAATGGRAIGKRHHPNFFVADSGWQTWSGTTATYMSTIASALDTMDGAATDARAFSADLLETFKPSLIKKRISPAGKVNGKPFWLLFVHPDVMAQARADTRIAQATESAFRGKVLDDPMLNGCELYYNGFAIMENLMVGMEVHETSGTTVLYGAVDSAETSELNQINAVESTDAADRNLKVSLIVGSNAMSVGQVNSFSMVPKVSDYTRVESIGATMIWGANRNDDYDTIATVPTTVQNFSSAVLATNSPALA